MVVDIGHSGVAILHHKWAFATSHDDQDHSLEEVA